LSVPRAFVAVPIVVPEVVDRLVAAQRSLRVSHGVTWVARDRLHFTLKFLGEVPEPGLADAALAVKTVAAGQTSFSLELRGLGVFPPRGDPRVVWAGCGEGGGLLESLAAGVEAEFTSQDFPAETRPFAAHLTLGRVKQPRAGREVRRRLREEASESLVFGAVSVAEIVLFTSRLAPQGPTYARVATGILS
jgi:2'-5' RNA ligase